MGPLLACFPRSVLPPGCDQAADVFYKLDQPAPVCIKVGMPLPHYKILLRSIMSAVRLIKLHPTVAVSW